MFFVPPNLYFSTKIFSPKKTKEGFIGGGLITLLVGTLFTYCLMTPYLVCPVQFNPDYVADLISQLRPPSRPLFQVSACQVSPVFRPRPLQVSENN